MSGVSMNQSYMCQIRPCIFPCFSFERERRSYHPSKWPCKGVGWLALGFASFVLAKVKWSEVEIFCLYLYLDGEMG